MGLDDILLVLAGALLGGFVNGFAGFGTGITALGLWLYALPPPVAATLVVVCSAAAQLQTLPRIWHAIEVSRVAPFALPGLLAVPVGTLLLTVVEVRAFKLAIAVLLIGYAAHALWHRRRSGLAWGGRLADGGIGFASGLLGGLAGLSGPLLTVWADIRGWTKAQKRGTFQAFNLTILAAALLAHVSAGLITRDLLMAVAVALPGTFVGARLGAALYTRVSDSRFNQIILVLLGLSGCGLIWTNL